MMADLNETFRVRVKACDLQAEQCPSRRRVKANMNAGNEIRIVTARELPCGLRECDKVGNA
jgi:hypothetical protein